MKFFSLNIKAMVLVICSLALLTGFATGEEVSIDIENGVLIQDPESTDYHFLTEPDMALVNTNVEIIKASLNVSVLPITNDTTYISVRCHPILVDWNPDDVGWDHPWTNPGGNYDEINYSEWLLTDPGEQEIQFDITDLVMRWADGRLPYHGLLFKVSKASHHNMTIQNDGGSLATISITYFPLPDE